MRPTTAEEHHELTLVTKPGEAPTAPVLQRRLLILALLAISLATRPAYAQSAVVTDLLRREFVTNDFAVKSYGPIHWVGKGEFYTVLEPSEKVQAMKDIVRYETASSRREILVSAAQLTPTGADKPLEIESYSFSEDFNRVLIFTDSKRVWRLNTRGDYWVLDRKAGTLRKLGNGGPAASLMFAKFSPDGSKVAYVRFNNIYVEDLLTGVATRITSDGGEKVVNGTADWVYEEEFFLRDGFRWSPDGKRIAYWQFDTHLVDNFPLIYDAGAPYRVTTGIPYPEFGAYPNVRQIPYPQPGTTNSSVRVGVVAALGGETQWMKVPGYANENYLPRMEWAGDSDTLILQHLNRLQNTNDILLADARTGSVRSIHTDRDAAWVDIVDEVKWLHGGKEFVWVSEQDGWRHVYVISRDGKHVRLVTPGAFDVIEFIDVDPGEEWLYFIASPENATQRYLYRVRVDGKTTPERLTPASQPGTHSYKVSPDLHWAFHTFSTFDTPPITDLVRLPDHRVLQTVEDNAKLRSAVKDLVSAPTEFVRIDIGEGVTLDGWLIKPKNFLPSRKYPVLVYVYGEPAAQTVVDRWDEGVFHRALAQDGYVIVSFDNRGTPAPKGRAWRKIIYGSVGVLSSKEQALALLALEKTHPYLDPDRIAVWGRSGGGSSTLNLMFRYPEVYKLGMAVAPVPDQRLYDTIYQERFMGLPQDNPEGYKAGSPINFAEGLRGRLLLVHGSGDDNVHYQGTELLVNRLIELGKTFDFMTYPGRTHALVEGPGTAFHLHNLLARYLEENLPPNSAMRE
ncbi:MAG TPA: S9 family peptidase [Candidatus Solibacter sp.]|nr:S9 family peptidase [Candidatus Solibacter sp.]